MALGPAEALIRSEADEEMLQRLELRIDRHLREQYNERYGYARVELGEATVSPLVQRALAERYRRAGWSNAQITWDQLVPLVILTR